jgi:hypothetical protein
MGTSADTTRVALNLELARRSRQRRRATAAHTSSTAPNGHAPDAKPYPGGSETRIDSELRVHDAMAQGVPIQLTSFVGREREGAEVRRLLSSTRLATLTALVGVSKTRLAL